jgi:hypothetical protein
MSTAVAVAAPSRESLAARARRKGTWGYFVWIGAACVIVIPELLAAFNVGLPFTTISTMTGHLERHYDWVELIVVAIIVFVVFSLLKLSPRNTTKRNPNEPQRMASGRLTANPEPPMMAKNAGKYDEETAPAWFIIAALVSSLAIAVATWATDYWFDDGSRFRSAYVLYGLLALGWLIVPTLIVFFTKADAPFPTLFRTVESLQEWLEKRRWPMSLGPSLAWAVGYVVVTGLVILLLHLALYPYPNITKILNPNG